jgi:prolipoprotein diacylglyceryltransferase
LHRVLFQIGGLTVYSYGVFLAIGFIVATFVARYRFSEKYKNPDIILDFVLAAVVGGIVGARLFYVAGHWSEFSGSPGKIFTINMSGLVFYGGLVFGLALALLVGRWKKVVRTARPRVRKDRVLPQRLLLRQAHRAALGSHLPCRERHRGGETPDADL